MKTLHTDEWMPLASATSRRGKPVFAYVALILAALLMTWVVMSPRLVHGQSKAGEKLVASTTTTTVTTTAVPAAAELSPKEQAAVKSKARLTEEELERLRAQIIETSKLNKAKAKNK